MGRPPHFYLACGTIVALRKPRDPPGSWGRADGRPKNYETSYRYCFQLVALFLRRHVRYKKPGRRIRCGCSHGHKGFRIARAHDHRQLRCWRLQSTGNLHSDNLFSHSMSALRMLRAVWLSTSLTCMAAVSFREDTEPFAQAGLVVLCTSICKMRPSESI